MLFLKNSSIIFLILISPIAHSTVLEETINPAIQKVQINGTMDVELNSYANINNYKVTYEGEKNSTVTVENKNGILYVQSNGVFSSKPHLKIDLVNSPLEYSANGVGESVLYINSETNFNITLNGVNKAKLIGKSDSIHFTLQGTSTIDVVDYSAKAFQGDLNGISSVYIKETAPFTFQKSGISNIHYK